MDWYDTRHLIETLALNFSETKKNVPVILLLPMRIRYGCYYNYAYKVMISDTFQAFQSLMFFQFFSIL